MLVFAPASDETAVATLRHGIGYLYRSEEKLHISSALYLFKDDRWTVFQAPAKAPAPTHGSTAPAAN
jgi:hypothetical protein